MSSYNLINGIHADMNEHTLKNILRGEWKYDGYLPLLRVLVLHAYYLQNCHV